MFSEPQGDSHHQSLPAPLRPAAGNATPNLLGPIIIGSLLFAFRMQGVGRAPRRHDMKALEERQRAYPRADFPDLRLATGRN
jgi:hypothetical protein